MNKTRAKELAELIKNINKITKIKKKEEQYILEKEYIIKITLKESILTINELQNILEEINSFWRSLKITEMYLTNNDQNRLKIIITTE
ncbi:MAG: hypothetical protein PHR26_04145 [Candidatus ainarchaeum sp.]|nr:hypothetical protein [Candidatus ainarchaeum sp.]MDD3976446.1 hypothetical protein [Candidatus ainarchaeum sp.]